MAAVLQVLLRGLAFLGVGFLNVAKSSLAGVVAFVTWIAMHITERAVLFVALRLVLLAGLTRCIMFFTRLIASFAKPQLSSMAQMWEDSKTMGSLIPGALVHTLNLSYILKTIGWCFEVWLACFSFRVIIYEFKQFQKFAGITVKK